MEEAYSVGNMENADERILTEEEQQPSVEAANTTVQSQPSNTLRRRLLPGKRYHLFISCSSEDNSYSKELVLNLEKRVQIHCMHHERDFLGGLRILKNVAEAIELCEKFLVILTPAYLKSGYCEDEMEQARDYYVRNRKKGHLICLKLEPCEIPKEMRHITYIDGHGLSAEEVADKIQRAFERNESYMQCSPNGMELVIGSIQKKTTRKCVGSRYVFAEHPQVLYPESDLEGINKIALGMYEDAKERMNSFWWMRILGRVWSNCLLCLVFPCGILSFLVLLMFVIWPSQKFTDSQVVLLILVPLPSYIFLPMISYMLTYLAFESYTKDRENCTWSGITKGMKYFVIVKNEFVPVRVENNLSWMLYFYDRLVRLCLTVVYYDIGPCRKFLEDQLMTGMNPELTADNVKVKLDSFMCDAFLQFAVQKSTYGIASDQHYRHPTYMDTPCLCQRVEKSKEYKTYLMETRGEQVDIENLC